MAFATGFVVSAVVDATKAIRALNEIEKRADEYATRAAINITGKKIKQAESAETLRIFDSPHPRTVKAFYFKPATKADRRAWVWIQDQGTKEGTGVEAVRWLSPHVFGVRRGWKAMERSLQAAGVLPAGWFAVPGAVMPLDRYGNIESGPLRKVLSQLRAQRNRGIESRTGGATNDKRKRARTLERQQFRVFAVKPNDKSHLVPGVYSADLFGRNLSPLLIFVQSVSYSDRFKFYAIAQRVFDATFRREFDARFKTLVSRFSAQGLR